MPTGVTVTRGADLHNEDALIGQKCLIIAHVFGIGFKPSQVRAQMADGWTPEAYFDTLAEQIDMNIHTNMFVEVQIINLVSITAI